MMSAKEPKKRIIDKRNKEKFFIDDEYLNGYAKYCGWNGTLVYMSLCRHANREQSCFPSIELMARQHGISEKSIQRGISNLKSLNIISVRKQKTKKGTWKVNSYTLLDKSVWRPKPNQGTVRDVDDQGTESTEPADSEVGSRRTQSPTKEPQGEGTKKKVILHSDKIVADNNDSSFAEDNGMSEKGKSVNEVIKLFEPVNPLGLQMLFKNKTERDSAERLLKKMGRERIEECLKFIKMSRDCRKQETDIKDFYYIPNISTPLSLETGMEKVNGLHAKVKKKLFERYGTGKNLTIFQLLEEELDYLRRRNG
jgi:transcription initiation factor IIE alpha subunit